MMELKAEEAREGKGKRKATLDESDGAGRKRIVGEGDVDSRIDRAKLEAALKGNAVSTYVGKEVTEEDMGTLPLFPCVPLTKLTISIEQKRIGCSAISGRMTRWLRLGRMNCCPCRLVYVPAQSCNMVDLRPPHLDRISSLRIPSMRSILFESCVKKPSEVGWLGRSGIDDASVTPETAAARH